MLVVQLHAVLSVSSPLIPLLSALSFPSASTSFWVVEAHGSVQLIVPTLNPFVGSDVGIKGIPRGNQERTIHACV